MLMFVQQLLLLLIWCVQRPLLMTRPWLLPLLLVMVMTWPLGAQSLMLIIRP